MIPSSTVLTGAGIPGADLIPAIVPGAAGVGAGVATTPIGPDIITVTGTDSMPEVVAGETPITAEMWLT